MQQHLDYTPFTVADSLSDLMAQARRAPLLDKETEHELAVRWRDHQDQEAARQLVESHLRLAIKTARGYSGYGLPTADLVSEGLVGLVQAVQKFDPEQDVRFATYALWWIRAAVQEHVLKHWSQVKLGTTAAQKKLFFNLNKLKSALGKEPGEDLLPDDVRHIAEALNVSEAEVKMMHGRMSARDQSLQAPLGEEGDAGSWQDRLVGGDGDPEGDIAQREELAYRQQVLSEAIDETLDPRQRHILMARRLSEEPQTLEQLAETYGISRERVRQIENQAFAKVQSAVRSMVARGRPVAGDLADLEKMAA